MGTSRHGEDLIGNIQATKAKQTFLDMPREVLNKLTDDVYNVAEHFAVENFPVDGPVPNAERQNPYAKLMQIQNVAIAIQKRNVVSKDEVYQEDLQATPKGPQSDSATRNWFAQPDSTARAWKVFPSGFFRPLCRRYVVP